MGAALARGLIASDTIRAANLLGYDPEAPRAESLRNELGLTVVGDNAQGASLADVIVLAVKPHLVSPVLREMRPKLQPRKLVISIAAGVMLATLEREAGAEVPVVRVMPNAPAQVRSGAIAIAAGSRATPQHLAVARRLLEPLGWVVEVGEAQMNAVTALSGSGPAFAAVFVDALADGGVAAGLPRDLALGLAARTVLGTAKMILEQRLHPSALKDMVASPGGTTAKGLLALERRGLRAAAVEAVIEAARRAAEISREVSAADEG